MKTEPLSPEVSPNDSFLLNVFFARSYVSLLSTHCNTPEEDDETMSLEEREANLVYKLADPPQLSERSTVSNNSKFSRQRWNRGQEGLLLANSSSLFLSRPPHSLRPGYSQPTPFPSQVSWLHHSLDTSWSGYPTSLPSCLSHKDDPNNCEESCLSRYKSLSLPSQHSTNMMSLEQPLSLRSNPPSAELYHHTLSPYSDPPQGPACCAQCPADAFSRRPVANKQPWTQYDPSYGPYSKSAHLILQSKNGQSSRCDVENFYFWSVLIQIQKRVDYLQLHLDRCESNQSETQ